MRKDHLSGIGLIAQERARQINAEGYTPEHDAQHVNGELAHAAAYYCMPATRDYCEGVLFPEGWQLASAGREGFPRPTLRDLVKAGAFNAAEIDRRLAAGEED